MMFHVVFDPSLNECQFVVAWNYVWFR